MAVLESELRGEKAWTQGFQARCRASFSSPPCPPVAPRQADAVALRRELEQLKAHPSTVEIDRLRFRAIPLFFRSIPRRSVSPARPSTSALTWRKKRSGPQPFFLFFPVPSGHLGVPSGHLGVVSGHSADGHLNKRAERAL